MGHGIDAGNRGGEAAGLSALRERLSGAGQRGWHNRPGETDSPDTQVTIGPAVSAPGPSREDHGVWSRNGGFAHIPEGADN
jgi:hypothetical protein